METDKELLLLAAKAAGIEVIEWHPHAMTSGGFGAYLTANGIGNETWWNPLLDDAQAFRLAVKLGLVIYMPDDDDRTVVVRTSLLGYSPRFMEEAKRADPYAATRRAVVRAAAALAKEREDEAAN